MYIKNIDPSIFGDIPYKLRFTEGSIVFGKILFNNDSFGAIKLFDGTIIPAIFLSENNMEQNSFIKFKVEGFRDEFITLSKTNEEKTINENSINIISSKLSIPLEKGREIIYSLLKFNLPATDANILTIYKNLEFIDKAKNLTPKELLNFLREKINSTIEYDSREFKIAQNALTTIKKVDIDFLSFLIENQISPTVEKTTLLKDLLKNNFLYNNLIDSLTLKELDLVNSDSILINLKEPMEADAYNRGLNNLDIDDAPFKNTDSENNFSKLDFNKIIGEQGEGSSLSKSNTNYLHLYIEKLLKRLPEIKEEPLLNAAEKLNIKELKVNSLEEIFNTIISKTNSEDSITLNNFKNFINKLDLLNHLMDNYSIYNFNTKVLEDNFKNSIIIKNKYKGSKYLDPNNIKAFITVDTPSLGLIEGYVHKKNDELVVLLKTMEDSLNIFEKHVDILKNKLLNSGYRSVNISLEKLKNSNNIILLSNFFNDYGFQELDVKV